MHCSVFFSSWLIYNFSFISSLLNVSVFYIMHTPCVSYDPSWEWLVSTTPLLCIRSNFKPNSRYRNKTRCFWEHRVIVSKFNVTIGTIEHLLSRAKVLLQLLIVNYPNFNIGYSRQDIIHGQDNCCYHQTKRKLDTGLVLPCLDHVQPLLYCSSFIHQSPLSSRQGEKNFKEKWIFLRAFHQHYCSSLHLQQHQTQPYIFLITTSITTSNPALSLTILIEFLCTLLTLYSLCGTQWPALLLNYRHFHDG